MLRHLFLERRLAEPAWWKWLLNGVLAAVLVALFFLFSLNRIAYALDVEILKLYRFRLGQGFVMTLKISLASLVLSLVIGALVAVAYRSSLLVLRYLARGYVKIIRGTPLMMQIYLFFYIVGTAWQVTNRFWAGVIILSLFEGAYVSEIVRGSYESLDKPQLDAARGGLFKAPGAAACHFAADGLPHIACPHRAVCVHHQGFLTFGPHFPHRTHPDHAGDDGRSLQPV